MIILRTRKPASEDPEAFLRHVFHGEDNEQIRVFQGTPADVCDMVADARRWRRDFAYRHFIVAPGEMPAEGMFLDAVDLLAAEFGFPAEDAVVVGHKKPRHGLEGAPYHLHVLVREVDALNGRVLGSSWDFARHEKISRMLEARWGHAVVPGRWNKAALTALRASGALEAETLEAAGLAGMAKAEARYPKGLDRELERKTRPAQPDAKGRRKGRRMAEVAEAVADARVLSGGDAAGFVRMLAEAGLRVVPGDKRGRWVIEAKDPAGVWHFAGALNRLARMTVDGADEWMTGPSGPASVKGRNEHEQGGQALAADRLRGSEAGHARRGRAAGGGPSRDADGLRGGVGQRDDGRPADGPARPGRGRRRRERARPDRGAAVGAGAAAQGEQREDWSSRHAALLARIEGRGHAPGGGGRGAAVPGGVPGRTIDLAALAPTPGRVRALMDVRAVAAVQWRLGSPSRLGWLEERAAQVRPPLQALPEAWNRTVQVAESERARRKRRAAFLAVLLKRAYSLSEWLPPETLLHLRRVDVHPETGTVLITLNSGTRILDTGDRVTVRGTADDIAISELVACAERRGWQAVEVSGSAEFRAEASRALLLRGIDVVDCPLTPEEQAALRGEGPGVDWQELEAGAYAEPGLVPRPPWADN